MWRNAATIGGVVVLLGCTLWLVLIVSIRTQLEPVLSFLRKMNRSLTNRMVMKKAGQPGSNASVVRHKGRVSGASYETPVAVAVTDNGFAVPLPYGERPDWLKNLVAAGGGEVVHQGEIYAIDHPELVGADRAEDFFGPKERRTNRLYGLDRFLLVRSRVLETETSGL